MKHRTVGHAHHQPEAQAAAASTGYGNKGWIVAFSGLGLNLALGVLYTWSVFAKQMTEAVEVGGWGLTKTQASLPYMLAIGVFALMMVPAGRLQDRMGPRVAATAGAVLTGAGMFVSSFAGPGNLLPVLVGFGLMAGSGFGLGYAAATPAAIKWFPPEKKGMITGIVVSGFGLAPLYIAPLSKHLLGLYGVDGAFRILGLAFTVVTLVLARMIVNPPLVLAATAATATAGMAGSIPAPAPTPSAMTAPQGAVWREMLASRSFYLLYIEYTFAALAGLMIIGHLAKIIAVQSGGLVQTGFLFVASMSVFNAGGRLMAGILSDKFGRIRTLAVVLLSQAAVMLVFPGLSGMGGFFVGSAIVGFSYGACLALFPATTADFWGAKNFGLNYGLLFTAWGVGGMFGPLLAGRIADASGSYQLAYYIAAGLLVAAAGLTTITKRPLNREG